MPLEIFHRVSASSSSFQKRVSWIGSGPSENEAEKASRSMSVSQSRSRIAIHWRLSDLS